MKWPLIFVLALVLTVSVVSGKSASIYSTMLSLFGRSATTESHETTQSFQVSIDFSDDHTFTVYLLDKKKHLSSEETPELLRKSHDAYLLADFSEPLSLDILVPSLTCSAYSNQIKSQTNRLFSVRLFFSRELDNSSNLHESSEAHQNLSMCGWFYTVLLPDPDGFFKSDLAKLECALPQKPGLLSLHFEFGYPNEYFKKTVHLFFKPNMEAVFENQMIIILDRAKDAQSISDLKNLVKDKLNNPNARLRDCFVDPDYGTHRMIGSKYCDYERETVIFRNRKEFTTETMRFINETCNPEIKKEKYDRFGLADYQQVQTMLEQSKFLRWFWNGTSCPIVSRRVLIDYSEHSTYFS